MGGHWGSGAGRPRRCVIGIFFLLAGCVSGQPAGEPYVDTTLAPKLGQAPADVRPTAISRDSRGVATKFLVGIVRVRTASADELRAFVARYGGEITGSDALTAAAARAAQVPPEPGRAVVYTVRVDLARAPLPSLAANLKRLGYRDATAFSSPAALATFAVAADAAANGFKVAPDFLDEDTAFPETLFATAEGPPTPPPAKWDAFTLPRFGAAGDAAASNVIPAWQFVAAHGIKRSVKVAVVDRGYWLKLDGTPASSDTDFPPTPEQWDLVGDDAVAAGASSGECTGETRCDWHGTGSAGVAVGLANNGGGRAGVGALVASPLLLKRDDGVSGRFAAIAVALSRGADVVTISSGSNCNYLCRQFQVDTMIADHVKAGGRTVFVASAGNDNWPVGDPNFIHPCTLAYVICVGALADNSTAKIGYSNFGSRIDVFAPTNIPSMPAPPNDGPGPVAYREHNGTSAAAPFVAGIVAMMKAINPDLGAVRVAEILRQTARPGTNKAERVVDALAAVRVAAADVAPVPDSAEPGLIEFGGAPTGRREDLSLSAGDVDVARVATPQPSTITVTLDFPKDLGKVRVDAVENEGPDCPVSQLVSVSDPGPPPVIGAPAGGAYRQTRSYTYRVGGGTHRLRLRADGITAYDLGYFVTPTAVAPDAYEPNDTVFQAKALGYDAVAWEEAGAQSALHSPATPGFGDVDVWWVKGVMGTDFTSGGMGFAISSFPAFRVFGNESRIKVDLYRRDGGDSIVKVGMTREAEPCGAPLVIPLTLGAEYFVLVSGEPGAYSVSNGTHLTVERLNYFNLENVLTRPGPVEIGSPRAFVVPPDPTLKAFVTEGRQVHLRLVDPRTGRTLAEGRRFRSGERLAIPRAMATPAVLEVKSPAGGRLDIPARLSIDRFRPATRPGGERVNR